MVNKSLRMNYNSIIKFILVMIAIMTTASSLVMITRFPPEIYYLLPITFFLVLGLLKLILKRGQLNLVLLLFGCLLSCLVLISALLNIDYNIINFAVVGMVLSPVFLFLIIKPKDFADAYIKTMVFISIYSIITTYLIPAFLPSLAGYFPIRQNSGGYNVRDYIFSFHYIGLVSRNTGIFREMGVYSVFLNFALFFVLFIENKIKHTYVVLFVIIMAIISTLSTPGLIAMALILFAHAISNVRFNLKRFVKTIILVMVILVLLISVIPNATSYLRDSINKLVYQGSSYEGRMDVLISNTKVWGNNLFFGNGYTKATEMANENSLFETYHNTSTTTSYLSFYGLFFSLIISSPILMFISTLKCNKFSKGALIGGIFLLINSQFLVLDLLYYILTYYFLLSYLNYNKRKGVIL